MGFWAYDYVRDAEGRTYVIRGRLANRAIYAAKVIYSPSRPAHRKCCTRLPAHRAVPKFARCPLADSTVFLLSPEDIVAHYPRNQRLLKEESPSLPVVQQFCRIVESLGCEIYLFGSRRLDIAAPDSDWDCLITLPPAPPIVLSAILGELCKRARRYNEPEIVRRARRYAWPAGPNPVETLIQVFSQTTTYLKTRATELGIFFISKADGCLPDLPKLLHVAPQSISGSIVDSRGHSYLMPRFINIRTQAGTVATVKTTMWDCAGLEALRGLDVAFHGVRRICGSTWWFGGPEARMELLGD